MSNMEDRITVRRILEETDNAVFFGGAGVSTASGIPDFRGNGGLYRQNRQTAPGQPPADPPEYLLSRRCLAREPEKFFEFYRTHMVYPDAQPNGAHRALAALEARGTLRAVITQNIDGLHQKAGSRNVLELHGTVSTGYCVRCGRRFGGETVSTGTGVPRCACGGMIRPDVVLYGEALNEETLDRAERAVAEADVMIVGGTSLCVQPAASLVASFHGRTLVLINRSVTAFDGSADYIFRDPIEEILPALAE